MPVGTADKARKEIESTLGGRQAAIEFDVVSNPEFLKEGAAIQDCMRPDRVVIGTDNPRTVELMRLLYDPVTRNHERLIVMDVRSSELTKYAANAMLATKISFMNELANLAEKVGAHTNETDTAPCFLAPGELRTMIFTSCPRWVRQSISLRSEKPRN